MLFDLPLEVVVAQEPWRQRVGHVVAVDSLGWSPESSHLCEGEVVYESREGSSHWVCSSCGYIGWANTHHHQRVQSTSARLAVMSAAYKERRVSEGLSENLAQQQMEYVMATALQAAASKRTPKELQSFIEKLARL